jgi:hypothetical protein
MPWETFARSLEIAAAAGIGKLNFFGGEPLINPACLDMMDRALGDGFDLILATNAYYLSDPRIRDRFLAITGERRSRVSITVGSDEFHLARFDPVPVVAGLRDLGYEAILQDYGNGHLILTELNRRRLGDVARFDSRMCCCAEGAENHIGILPDGSWALCPPSTLGFGSISTIALEELTAFKAGLDFDYSGGCTLCLASFARYRAAFEASRARP